jgi:hypothetical protein
LIAFVVRQRAGDHFPIGRDQGVGRYAFERLPVGDRFRGHADLGAVVELHCLEARGHRPVDEVTLIKIDHRQRDSLHRFPVDVADLCQQVVNRRIFQAEQDGTAVPHPEAVDGLEEGDPSALPKHSEELGKRRDLVTRVDQHRPGGDDVDGRVSNAGDVLGRSVHEAAPLVAISGALALVEQVLRAGPRCRRRGWPGATVPTCPSSPRNRNARSLTTRT